MLDWRALPPRLAATLYAGLPEGSRTALRRSGMKAGPDTALLAAIADRLSALLWMLSGGHGRQPESIFDALSPVRERGGFDTPEAFEEARARLMREE